MMIVIITVATIVGMMSIAVMRMTMEKDIYWDHNHRVLRLHLLNISVIGGWDGRKALNIEHFYWTLLNIFIFQLLGVGTVGRPWTASSSTTSRSVSGRSLGGRGWPKRGGGPPPPRSPTSSSPTASKRGADSFHTHIAPLNTQHPRKFLPRKQIHTKYPQLWFKRDTLEAKAALLWDMYRGWRSVID